MQPKETGCENREYHFAFPYSDDLGLNFASEFPKSGYNLQFHETFLEMTITTINICTSKKFFYVGTSEGIVSCFKYEVSKDVHYPFLSRNGK